MTSLNEIKIDLINLITRASDYRQLKLIYQSLLTETGKNVNLDEDLVDNFDLGKVEIRREVSKDEIFKEQGKKSIPFQEIQTLMTDEPWDKSLEEILATLD